MQYLGQGIATAGIWIGVGIAVACCADITADGISALCIPASLATGALWLFTS